MKLLPPEYDKSYTYVLVSSSTENKNKVIEAQYKFWPIATDNFGTYPIRSSAEAWQEVLDGNGVVASYGQNPLDTVIIIRRIYLAYYDSGMPDNYLQPIFVFSGDNGFAAYTPAIVKDDLTQ